jgi:hypothetical protein
MSETKYGKYIITELKEPDPEKRAPWAPQFTPEELVHIVCLDSGILEGAFYVATDWTYPPFARESHGKPHKHDFDEVLAFIGGDPDNPHELYAEAHVPLGDEVHIVTKSCLIFVPAGVMHGPIDFKRIDRPVFHFSCAPAQKYH